MQGLEGAARRIRPLVRRDLPQSRPASAASSPGSDRSSATWSYFVALVVYAYGQGGAASVGLVSVIRMLPAAIASRLPRDARRPLPATARDGRRRRARATLMLAALAISQGWSQWLVYAIVGLSTISGTVFRPAQAALSAPGAQPAAS